MIDLGHERYAVVRELGAGTFGTVYLARDDKLGRQVAVKVLKDSVPAEHRGRFDVEARAMAALDEHPNIVRIHDAGVLPSQQSFLVMEYMSGGSLDARTTRARMTSTEVGRLMAQIAEAVHHLHTRGLVHRDIKPANIMLSASGTPKLGDFGVVLGGARSPALRATLGQLGTPEYAAPEVAFGALATRLSDVYSLGATMFDLLTGEPAPPEVRADPSGEIPERVTPRALADVVASCMEVEPDQRPGTAAIVAGALADATYRDAGGTLVPASRPSASGAASDTRPRTRQRLRRRRLAALGVVLVALVAVAATGFVIGSNGGDADDGASSATLGRRAAAAGSTVPPTPDEVRFSLKVQEVVRGRQASFNGLIRDSLPMTYDLDGDGRITPSQCLLAKDRLEADQAEVNEVVAALPVPGSADFEDVPAGADIGRRVADYFDRWLAYYDACTRASSADMTEADEAQRSALDASCDLRASLQRVGVDVPPPELFSECER